MNSSKFNSDLMSENGLNMPYIEIMFPPPEETSIFLDSQSLEINQVQIPSEAAVQESEKNKVSDEKLVEKSVGEILSNKMTDYLEKPEENQINLDLERQIQIIQNVVDDTNILESVENNCTSKPMEECVNGKEYSNKSNDCADNVEKVKIISSIHPSEKCLPKIDNSHMKDNNKINKDSPSGLDTSQENLGSLLSSEEDGETVFYLGPFMKNQKIQVAHLEQNEMKPVSHVDSISNGLIIEIYHYWMKQKYKISRLCLWIRNVCPHHLDLKDSSLYVKIKNLIKMKHKQLIRSKTKKFEGCFEAFQSGPFFKSENLLMEDLSNETPKEKLLRIELKKAQKIIHRQEKIIVRKNSIIKSISYDLSKLTHELDSMKELNKSAKKDGRGVVFYGKKSLNGSFRDENLPENDSENMQTSHAEGGTRRGRRSLKDKRKSPLLEIEDYFSVSWTMDDEGGDDDESLSRDTKPSCETEDGRRRGRKRRNTKTPEIKTKNNKRMKTEVANSEIPAKFLSLDLLPKVKLEPLTGIEGVL